jgi:hypothetical protein
MKRVGKGALNITVHFSGSHGEETGASSYCRAT